MITLTTNKNTSLEGVIKCDEQYVAHMSAVISADADGRQDSVNVNIQNKELYNANKSAVRSKIAEFQQLVWEEQDKLAEDTVTEN